MNHVNLGRLGLSRLLFKSSSFSNKRSSFPWPKMSMVRRNYGSESSDIAVYAHQGKFPDVDPDDIENCYTCRGYLEERNDLLDDVTYAFVRSFHSPWAIKWLEFHEADKNDAYDHDLLTLNGKSPYSSCGPGCCLHEDSLRTSPHSECMVHDFE
jgi:hypothetical protein